MNQTDGWKVFEMTGSVKDYLSYKQQNYDDQKRKDVDEWFRAGRNNSAGHDSSECSTRGF